MKVFSRVEYGFDIDFLPFYGDCLNLHKKRNIKNSNRLKYNCGGYAFNTFNWYCPYPPGEWGKYLTILEEEGIQEALKCSARETLKHFPNIRIINNLGELRENERAIAYRVSFDGDIHYMKKAKNGSWYDKRGNLFNINRHSEEEVFSNEPWYNRYDSDTIIFAFKD